jgi:hypothetical protein
MRKLTEQERELWISYTTGVVKLENSTTLPPISNKQIRPILDVSFNPTLDLHNLTLQTAHERSKLHIEEAYYLGIKKVQHITGKSGQISKEFETWVKLNDKIRKIKKQNDGGAWVLWIRKK